MKKLNEIETKLDYLIEKLDEIIVIQRKKIAMNRTIDVDIEINSKKNGK